MSHEQHSRFEPLQIFHHMPVYTHTDWEALNCAICFCVAAWYEGLLLSSQHQWCKLLMFSFLCTAAGYWFPQPSHVNSQFTLPGNGWNQKCHCIHAFVFTALVTWNVLICVAALKMDGVLIIMNMFCVSLSATKMPRHHSQLAQHTILPNARTHIQAAHLGTAIIDVEQVTSTARLLQLKQLTLYPSCFYL